MSDWKSIVEDTINDFISRQDAEMELAYKRRSAHAKAAKLSLKTTVWHYATKLIDGIYPACKRRRQDRVLDSGTLMFAWQVPQILRCRHCFRCFPDRKLEGVAGLLEKSGDTAFANAFGALARDEDPPTLLLVLADRLEELGSPLAAEARDISALLADKRNGLEGIEALLMNKDKIKFSAGPEIDWNLKAKEGDS